MRSLNVIGHRFGKLVVLQMDYTGKNTAAVCACDCGIQSTKLVYNLKNGNTTSCGCGSSRYLRKGKGKPKNAPEPIQAKIDRIRKIGFKNRKHGHTACEGTKNRQSQTYVSWLDARKRCFDEKNKRFIHYGERGITMCQRWKNSFAAFLSDMGEKPDGTTLDRINVNGNYEHGNCRWASRHDQAQNTRRNVATADAVRKIRALHAAGAGVIELANNFAMSRSNVQMIVSRKTWSNIV